MTEQQSESNGAATAAMAHRDEEEKMLPLAVPLDDETLSRLAGNLAVRNRELQELESQVDQAAEDYKAQQKDFKERREALMEDINELHPQVETAACIQDVPYTISYHDPHNGQKTIIRKDTDTTWTEPMTAEDHQAELPLEGEPVPQAGQE